MSKNILLISLLTISLAYAKPITQAKPDPFNGQDLSGNYMCRGEDHQDGKFSGTLTLKLDQPNSHNKDAGYSMVFSAENDNPLYIGYATTHNDSAMALYFKNINSNKANDFGVASIEIKSNKDNTWLKETYYQPSYKGGNYGTKFCTKK
jgi:hypothetical protein